jgi:hypothetical protein
MSSKQGGDDSAQHGSNKNEGEYSPHPYHPGMTGFSADDISDLLGSVFDTTTIPQQQSMTAAPPVYYHAAQQQPAVPCAQHRSERKRSREKQRRTDINRQFQELTSTMKLIELTDQRERYGNVGNEAEGDVEEESPESLLSTAQQQQNRVELIAKANVWLRRYHQERLNDKDSIRDLQDRLTEAVKAGEETAAKLKEAMHSQKFMAPPPPMYQPQQQQQPMMMMVPVQMMPTPSGTDAAAAPTAAAPMAYFMPPAPTQSTDATAATPAQPYPMVMMPSHASAWYAPQPTATPFMFAPAPRSESLAGGPSMNPTKTDNLTTTTTEEGREYAHCA